MPLINVNQTELSKVKNFVRTYADVTADYSGSGKYQLLADSYTGSGGYENGKYLINHPREPYEKFLRRRQMAYYCNYVAPCVDGVVDPIFKTSPTREGFEGSPLFSAFLSNVDGKGTTMDRFMKNAAVKAKLNGACYIVIDNYMQNEVNSDRELSLAESMTNRIYPYLYIITPNNVTDYSMDRFGNISMIKYQLDVSTVDDNGNITKSTESYTWTNTKCIKEDDNGVTSVINEIGTIPVIPLYGAVNLDNDLKPQSSVYSIARTNLAIYNASSELRERNRNQAFSVLTYPLAEDEEESDIENSGDEDSNEINTGSGINVGSADMLMYKNGSQKPEYITPESGPSEVLITEITTMIQEIYRMAKLQFATGTYQQTSGIAREWDNQQLFQTIAEFANNLEAAEVLIAGVFFKYTNKAVDFKVHYNNQFGIADPTETLNLATQALALNICPQYNLEYKKKVIRDTLKDCDEAVVKDVIANLLTTGTATDGVNTDPTVLSYNKK